MLLGSRRQVALKGGLGPPGWACSGEAGDRREHADKGHVHHDPYQHVRCIKVKLLPEVLSLFWTSAKVAHPESMTTSASTLKRKEGSARRRLRRATLYWIRGLAGHAADCIL